MQIADRVSLWGGKRLPFDAEVEWIGQTNNAQFITTKVLPPVGSILRCRFRFTDLRNSFCAIGYSTAYRFGFGIEQGTFKVSTNGWSSTIMQPDTLWHNWERDETLGTASIDDNSVGIRLHSAFSGDSWDNGFTLFRRLRYYDTYDYSTYGAQCAGLYIGTANTALFDGIPVRMGEVGYLYDRVSGTLFGNAGTGEFIVGPDAPAMTGGGYKRLCVKRSHRRSSRPSARFWHAAHLPRTWKEVA